MQAMQKLPHITCNDISPTEYLIICSESCNKNWICLLCTVKNTAGIIQFTLEADESLFTLNSIHTHSLTNQAPSFDKTSQLTNLPNLSDYDIDENINLNIISQYKLTILLYRRACFITDF